MQALGAVLALLIVLAVSGMAMAFGIYLWMGVLRALGAPIGSQPTRTQSQPTTAEDYREYLQSPHWQRTRQRKLDQMGHRCEIKGCEADEDLEVRHLHYQTLGRERMRELMVLCHDHYRVADRLDVDEVGASGRP